QDALTQGAGLTKCKDLYGWKYVVGDIPKRALAAYEEVRAMPEVVIRSVRLSNIQSELRLLMEVFNDAWSENFHFVPMTEAELTKMAQDMRLLIDEQIALVAEVNGRAAAVALSIP